jgi:lysophospholipase L1-like esterase
VVVFGDGIAAGNADPLNGGWAGHLRLHLKSVTSGSRLFNFAVAGDDSSRLLERFEPQCMASNPSIILIAVGINDTRYAEDSSRPDNLRYSLNIERLIAQALAISRQVTFVGLTRVDERRTMPFSRDPLTNFDNELILVHDSALQRVCQMHSVTCVPMFDLLADEDLADGLHPNAEGHQKMFQRLLNFF